MPSSPFSHIVLLTGLCLFTLVWYFSPACSFLDATKKFDTPIPPFPRLLTCLYSALLALTSLHTEYLARHLTILLEACFVTVIMRPLNRNNVILVYQYMSDFL